MAYEKKTWKNRQSEYPNRRTLAPVDGQENTYDVTRAEGLVMEEGDPFNQESMNDLENRIYSGFADGGVNVYSHTRSGTVQGISGRVDMNHLYRDFPGETSKEDIPMYTSNTLKIGPVSGGDRAAIRSLAERLGVATADDGDYIIVGPMSAGDRAAVAGKALSLGLGCEDYTTPEEPEEPQEPEEPTVDLSELTQAVDRLVQAVVELNKKVDTQITDIAEILDKLSAAGAALQ